MADGEWIAMPGSTPNVAVREFRAIGRPDLVEHPDYVDAQKRLENVAAIDELVAEWVATKTLTEAMADFEKYKIAAAPVYNAAQRLEDPHLRARKTYVDIPDAQLESVRVQAPAARRSDTPGRVEFLGRAVGTDNDDVYQSLLRFTDQRMADLKAAGVS